MKQPDPQSARRVYQESMQRLRVDFDRGMHTSDAGSRAVAARTAAADALLQALWQEVVAEDPLIRSGVSLVALGGYGRRELFPHSDVDLMFLLGTGIAERTVKASIRRLNQTLWDCGLRVSPLTRSLVECGRFHPENVEFTLALVDARALTGDPAPAAQLVEKVMPMLLAREGKKIAARLQEVTRVRHARYGDTIFHLEPNVKDCPGGLRDAHVCAWLRRLSEGAAGEGPLAEFIEAREFLILVRVFLHLRHGRDDNTLDWRAQDKAAASSLGTTPLGNTADDASLWMRSYFRHARAVDRWLTQDLTQPGVKASSPRRFPLRLPTFAALRMEEPARENPVFHVLHDRIDFTGLAPRTLLSGDDPAHDPEVVLSIFGTVARTGARVSRDAELRLERALPLLAAQLEDGPGLWRQLSAILTGPFAGRALRAMHALGILELLLPEFHGIDALVIRDAYHRYTVDEHTFILVDTLHALSSLKPADPAEAHAGLDLWAPRFSAVLRELPHPALLFLAALLHDTGKGYALNGHAGESARMAEGVLDRLELDPYESALVLDLIRNHLEMSAALRRDVFESETVRAFAARVPTPEALRMLTLFTYADISAVHPGALTPWKAEDLWRLYIASSNFLDLNLDEESDPLMVRSGERDEVLHRLDALLPGRRAELTHFLEGLPRRYLQTRAPEHVRTHFEMAAQLGPQLTAATQPSSPPSAQVDLHYAAGVSELTLVTRDRPLLFASVAGALAAWGMNIITAEAFSNAHGIVVDGFRFTDTFRTLELNESERGRFVENLRDVVSGRVLVEALLATRRRGRGKPPKVQVQSRVDFDETASTHSTVLQVVAQDTPGLLRALSLPIAEHGCNIELALIDTEGEMAIDVFYLTHAGGKLTSPQQQSLAQALLDAISAHLRSTGTFSTSARKLQLARGEAFTAPGNSVDAPHL